MMAVVLGSIMVVAAQRHLQIAYKTDENGSGNLVQFSANPMIWPQLLIAVA